MSTKARATLASIALSALFGILILVIQNVPLPDFAKGPPAPGGGGGASHEVDIAQAWADWEATPAGPRCDHFGDPTAPCNVPKYNREAQFGGRWPDVDGNGCDTRNDILARDLTDVELYSDNCTVNSGVIDDPYTGKTIDFKRGKDTSGEVQIDHVVPLALAWDLGADAWDQETRIRFANDPLNLLAVDGPANEKKLDKTMTEWMPPNSNFACAYVARVLSVSRAYGLRLTHEDKEFSATVLQGCS